MLVKRRGRALEDVASSKAAFPDLQSKEERIGLRYFSSFERRPAKAALFFFPLHLLSSICDAR
jgi:hypothetical protein